MTDDAAARRCPPARPLRPRLQATLREQTKYFGIGMDDRDDELPLIDLLRPFVVSPREP